MDWVRGTALMLVGLLLVGGGVWSLPSQDTDYVHYTTDGYETFNASQPGHFWYENLSTRGQTIVDRTVEQGRYVVDNQSGNIERERYVVDDESDTAPEFSYPQGTPNVTYVNRSGQVYAIGTYTDSPGLSVTLQTIYVSGPLVLVGFALCVSGVLLRLRNAGD